MIVRRRQTFQINAVGVLKEMGQIRVLVNASRFLRKIRWTNFRITRKRERENEHHENFKKHVACLFLPSKAKYLGRYQLHFQRVCERRVKRKEVWYGMYTTTFTHKLMDGWCYTSKGLHILTIRVSFTRALSFSLSFFLRTTHRLQHRANV